MRGGCGRRFGNTGVAGRRLGAEIRRRPLKLDCVTRLHFAIGAHFTQILRSGVRTFLPCLLLFGAPRLVRNLTLSGRRKMPGRDEYREVRMQVIDREETLAALGLNGRQLVDLCILVGTDFNPGVMGIGPKKALKLIKQHGTLAGALRSLGMEDGEMEKVRSIFLDYERTDDYQLAWRPPERQKVLDMLCGEYGFSEKRVNGALDKFSSGKKDQMRLDMF